MKVKVYNNDIVIIDCYKYTWSDVKNKLIELRNEYKDNDVLKHRSNFSLCFEWFYHKWLYKLGLFRSHTKDANLDWCDK